VTSAHGATDTPNCGARREPLAWVSVKSLGAAAQPRKPAVEAPPVVSAQTGAGPRDGRLRVVDIDPINDPRWLAFVSGHPEGLIYHHPAWLRVLEKEYGERPIGLACEDPEDPVGELSGILPLMWTRGLPFMPKTRTGRRLSSLPRTPVAGPLARHPQAVTALAQAAIERRSEDPGARLELKPSWTAPASLAAALGSMPWRKAYVLQLPHRVEDLRFGTSRNRARIKWAIGKSRKLGVQVRSADRTEDVRAWYRLYLETMRTKSFPPRPLRLFDAIWDELRPQGLMRLLLAEWEGRLIAGSLYLQFGNTVFYAFNGCRRSDLSLRPNDLLQWQAIQDSCLAGFRYYDLGEVASGNQGLAGFKAKWGGDELQLYRHYYPPLRQDDFREEASEPARGPRKLVEAGWRRVPLTATAALGDRIYRFL
jgi:CelD/BcsL family acetyltransferase involved in cellulose biosynthesis